MHSAQCIWYQTLDISILTWPFILGKTALIIAMGNLCLEDMYPMSKTILYHLLLLGPWHGLCVWWWQFVEHVRCTWRTTDQLPSKIFQRTVVVHKKYYCVIRSLATSGQANRLVDLLVVVPKKNFTANQKERIRTSDRCRSKVRKKLITTTRTTSAIVRKSSGS